LHRPVELARLIGTWPASSLVSGVLQPNRLQNLTQDLSEETLPQVN
jgi:hypothetical protein